MKTQERNNYICQEQTEQNQRKMNTKRDLREKDT